MHHNIPLGIVSPVTAALLIEQSLLFDGASYLSRTPGSAGNRKTWTFSCWFKRDASTSAATQMLFAGGSVTGANDTNWVQVFINSDGTFGVGGGATTWRVSSAKLADSSAWYHLTVNVDTTQATAADRIKMFLNGVQITSFGTNNAITLNADTGANSVAIHTIGRRDDASRYFSGLMALPILVDGAALDYTSFAKVDAENYINPIEYTGSYGINGGAYDFADTADFGKDVNYTGDTSVTFTDSSVNSGSATTYTFSSQAIGTASADRVVVVGTSGGAGNTNPVSSMTIGGVSAVKAIGIVNNTGTEIWYATVTSGTTASVVVNWGGTKNRCGIGVWALTGVTGVGATNTSTSSTATLTVSGRTKDIVLAVYGGKDHASVTFTGLTEDYDEDISGAGSQYQAGGSKKLTATGSNTITVTPNTGATEVAAVSAVFLATGNNGYFSNNFTASDQLADTPTDDATLDIGNHVSFTPLGRFTDITLSEANTVMTNASGDVRNCELSIAPESGKFIFEINPSTAGNIGMAFARNTYDRASNANWGNSLDAIRMFRESNTNLRTYYNTGSGVNVNIGVTIDNTNDRIVYAIDADNRYLWLGLWDASASAYIWLDGSGGVTGAPATGTNPTYTLPGTGAIYIAGETVSGQPITLYAAADKWLGSGVTGFVALATQNMDAASYSTPITGSFVGNAAVTQAWVYLGAAPNTAGTSTINGNTITWGTHAVAMATGFRLITTSSSYNSTGSNTFSIAVLGSDAGGAIQGGTGATTQGRAR